MLKKKRYKFQVELFLEELNAVTFPSAVLFAKLRLLDGGNFCEISSRYNIISLLLLFVRSLLKIINTFMQRKRETAITPSDFLSLIFNHSTSVARGIKFP